MKWNVFMKGVVNLLHFKTSLILHLKLGPGWGGCYPFASSAKRTFALCP